MRKVLLGFVLVLVVSGITYLRFRHPKPSLQVAYAGSHQVTLWSTTAQIREPAATVKFGDRLDVLNRLYDQVQVRTAAGVTGWASVRDLVSEEVWQKAKDLETKAASLPVAARGHTRVLSNLHVEPGRDSPRIRQLNKDVPVELFERQFPLQRQRRGPKAQTRANATKPRKKTGGSCALTCLTRPRRSAGFYAGLLTSTFLRLYRIMPVRLGSTSRPGSS
jgi:hypothetical protein